MCRSHVVFCKRRRMSRSSRPVPSRSARIVPSRSTLKGALCCENCHRHASVSAHICLRVTGDQSDAITITIFIIISNSNSRACVEVEG